jgi:hypothetical protein
MKFSNPSPDKFSIDSRGTSHKDLKVNQSKKIDSSNKLNTLPDNDNYRIDSRGSIQDDYFNSDSLGKESFSSKSVIKSSSKPYVKVVNNLKRDLSNQSSKITTESKSPRLQYNRKDTSKSKLTNASKISLYTSTSPGKMRPSKSPVRSNVFTTNNTSTKNVSVVLKKPNIRKISIVNKEKDNGISLESLLNFELIKNFTTLNYLDLQIEELIYSAEISNVYRGKYLHLPVAIKVYDIAKLKDEDIVR